MTETYTIKRMIASENDSEHTCALCIFSQDIYTPCHTCFDLTIVDECVSPFKCPDYCYFVLDEIKTSCQNALIENK